MNSPDTPQYDDFSRSNCIKKGTLFGLAVGMLFGLIWIGFAPPEGNELASIDRWGKVIVSGGVLGAVVGLFWPKPTSTKSTTNENKTGRVLNDK